MGQWLKRLWTDEEAWKAAMRRLWAFGIALAGEILPQLVDAGPTGWWGGKIVSATALLVASKPVAPKT